MTNVLTLNSPLMRRTVGFDRFNELFDSLLQDRPDTQDNYPPYNIEKFGDDAYRITMAVAGFGMDDLNIVLQGGTLSISGEIQHKEKDNDKDDVQYLHRGIATRAFERTFRLADYIQADGAALKDGMLTIDLVREVLEEKKARTIPINGSTKRVANKKKS